MNNTLGQSSKLSSDDFSIERQLSVILQSSKLSLDDYFIQSTYLGGNNSTHTKKSVRTYEKQKNTPTSSKARKGKSHNEVVN